MMTVSWKVGSRIKVCIELLSIGILVWMLVASWGHVFGQDVKTQLALQQQSIRMLLDHGGIIDQMNRHLDSTDQNVAALNDLANKLLGGLIALGGLQTLNLIVSGLASLKKGQSG